MFNCLRLFGKDYQYSVSKLVINYPVGTSTTISGFVAFHILTVAYLLCTQLCKLFILNVTTAQIINTSTAIM